MIIFRGEFSNTGWSVAKQRIETVDGQELKGRNQRGAVGVGDYETLAEYRQAVAALLIEAGVPQADIENDKFLAFVTQQQWNRRP